MKKAILILVLYIVGYVFSYNYMKSYIIKYKSPHEWTKGARIFTMSLSTFSWLSVIAIGIANLTQEAKNNTDKADW